VANLDNLYDWSFRQILEKAASSEPTPGGGSIAALVASLGVSMISMVGNLTVGKKDYQDAEEEVKNIIAHCADLMRAFEELTLKDIEVFENFMSTLRLPKNTEEEKTLRAQKLQEAYKKATDVPLETAATCLEGLKLAFQLSRIGNKGAISDVGVAAYNLEAALNSALLNVDINLPGIKDEEYKKEAAQKREDLAAEARSIKEDTLREVKAKMG
jgi:formiminotetrahydrofolate cyclodeaminase